MSGFEHYIFNWYYPRIPIEESRMSTIKKLSLNKILDSLTNEQCFALVSILSEKGTVEVTSTITERIRGLSEAEKETLGVRVREQFFDKVEKK